MTSRAWHIVRWFGFLAIGLAMAIGAGLRYRQDPLADETFASASYSSDTSLVAEPPPVWLAPESYDEPPRLEQAAPALVDRGPATSPADSIDGAVDSLDPDSPAAEREIDELGLALAGFDAQNVQLRTIEEGGRRRFVFSCDVPTDRGAQTFAGEGPDPPSAARNALGRIRAWASAPETTTLR